MLPLDDAVSSHLKSVLGCEASASNYDNSEINQLPIFAYPERQYVSDMGVQFIIYVVSPGDFANKNFSVNLKVWGIAE